MNAIKNGGPAFPMGANEYAGHGPCWGMTLRDYFAAKAMQGAAASSVVYSSELQAAQDAYRMADAMLKVREEC